MTNHEETAIDAPTASADVPKRPEVIYPTCPNCGADPLELQRLRYDFPDGVIAEVLFCSKPECRTAIAAQLVGYERPQKRKS